MNSKIRRQIERRQRKVARRLDKNINRGCDPPVMTASNIHYKIADRTRATAMSGFTSLLAGLRKKGGGLTDDEENAIRGFFESPVVSPKFARGGAGGTRRRVREDGIPAEGQLAGLLA